MALEIKNLHISADKNTIVYGVSFKISAGEIHLILGPNGSGKSSLVNCIMGHPRYSIQKGNIFIDKNDVTDATPDERAKKGLFLSMQNPPEIEGVSLANFLRTSKNSLSGENSNPIKFRDELINNIDRLEMDRSFAVRSVNKGFSGGEKKRAEILQMITLDPKYVMLDEIDSGLDVDSVDVIGKKISEFANRKKGILIISHTSRLLKHIKPIVVHIMFKGKIVLSGGPELINEVEKNGYKKFGII